MSLPKLPHCSPVPALLVLAALLAGNAAAQTLASNPPPAKATMTLRAGEMVGNEQIIRQFIRAGANEFAFVLPAEVRPDETPEGAPVLASRDRSYYLSVRLTTPSHPLPELRQTLKERVASQYPDALNLEDYTAWADGHEGAGFQLQQRQPQVGIRLIRILQVPFKAGVMEFILNADARNALAGQAALEMVLLTFSSNEHGPLEIIPRSDKT